MENPSLSDSLYPEDYGNLVPYDGIKVDPHSIKEFAEAMISETVVVAISALENFTKTVK